MSASDWFGATENDDALMREALAEAAKALEHGDVPVGALVLHEGRVIAARHNERELLGDPTAHAEVLAIRDAAAVLGTWRLTECTVVVTLEPCVMCAGALVSARVAKVIYGAADPKAGACLSLYNVCDDPRLNHTIELLPAVLEEECAELLSDFFADQRIGNA